MKRASAIFILREDGKVLAVPRKNDPNNYGMPGGKCNEGESFEDCAIRELKEETGILVFDMYKAFSQVDGEYEVETFIPRKYYGEINTTEVAVPAWVDLSVIMEGSFSEYNKALLDHLGIKWQK